MNSSMYAKRSGRSQILCLRPVAASALASFGLAKCEFRTLNHGFNTTFAVRAGDGRRFALRLNVNSHRTPEELRAEVAWVEALGHQHLPFDLPRPQRNLHVGFITETWAEPLDRNVSAALYSWLPGRDASDRADRTVGHEMGRALAALHAHGEAFQLPESSRLFRVRNCLFNRDYALHETAPKLDQIMIREVSDHADNIIERLSLKPLFPVHFDLHPSNVKWTGRLAVFDFDDCMLSRPAVDASVTTFYLRRENGAEPGFWQGFSGSKEAFLDIQGLSALEFETLVAARGIGLANELFKMSTADLAELAPKHALVMQERVKHFLKTGVHDPSVATLS